MESFNISKIIHKKHRKRWQKKWHRHTIVSHQRVSLQYGLLSKWFQRPFKSMVVVDVAQFIDAVSAQGLNHWVLVFAYGMSANKYKKWQPLLFHILTINQ